LRLDGTSPWLALRSERTVARAEVVLAVGVLAWCAYRLARGLGPFPFYNSDSAVPILLMRGLGEGPFTLYYPLQDRYGMWPLLVGRAFHLVTPESFHILQVLGLCSATLPMRRVVGSAATAVLTVLGPFALSQLVAWNNLQAGQPYLWQIVALCWAWGACRIGFTGTTRARRVGGLLGFWATGALATWVSTLSLAALVVILVLEAMQTRARIAGVVGGVVAIGLAALFEGQIRRLYNWYSRISFGERYITPLLLDRGHLLSNVGEVLGATWRAGAMVPMLLGAGALAIPHRTRTERFTQLGFICLGLCVVPAYVLVFHFRSNGFPLRYFSYVTFWGIAAAIYGGVLLLSALVPRWRRAVPLAGLVALAAVVPAGPVDPLAQERDAARRLVGQEPRVLLADYWDVYIPASLAPPGALIPVGADSNLNRFPATLAEVRPGRIVLAPCSLDAADGTLVQRGALLRRTADPPIPGVQAPWCLHTVERAARVPGPRRQP